MEEYKIRLLKAEEIECRAAIVKETGLCLLLYKDARVDQRILDETFGAFGWQRSHQCIDGNLYCTVSVYDKSTGLWISKQDVGAIGHAEKEKSQASDSFKRACFNWGIGRELYTAPFIWVTAEMATIRRDKNKDRLHCNDHFSVQSIGYNENREIHALTVMNDSNGRVVYEMRPAAKKRGAKASGEESAGTQKNAPGISSEQMESLEKELRRTGVEMDAVRERYQIERPERMTEELYQRVMAALAKTKTAA